MKVKVISQSKMRNDEYYQYHSEFIELTNRHGADELKFGQQFDAYILLFADVDAAMMKIMKSAYTAKINKADKRRDTVFRGLVDKSRAAEKHFRPEVQRAAANLKILFDKYGNISRRPLNEQTAATVNLLQELTGRFAQDIATVGIQEWVDELQDANNAFAELYRRRFDEMTDRTDIVLRKARTALDAAYRTIIERNNALVIVEGEEQWIDFIRSLNTVIDKYATIIKQRTGKAAAKK